MFFLRVSAAFAALALLAPVAEAETKKESLSKLSTIDVETKKDDIVVTLIGSKAPDFTSFTMSSPFRVVVDWAGSRIEGASDKKFERGLIRNVSTKQFDSEAEKISRVTIELSRETAYHVEADGTKVSIHFEPVADPIPEKKPEPVVEKKKKQELAYVPEGPLTEPDVPIPDEVPVPEPKVQIAEKKVEPKKVEPVVVAKVEPVAPKPEPVVIAEVKAPEKKPEPKKAEPVVVAKVAEPVEVVAPKEETPEIALVAPKRKKADVEDVEPVVEASEPVVAKVEPVVEKVEPVATKAEPKQLATFSPKTEPVKTETSEETMRVASPAPKAVRLQSTRTRQLASNIPKPKAWQPPKAGRARSLPVVKVKPVAQETIEPAGETPVDPDDPGGSSSASSDDFDPGPRVMKYIGFRQMADVSRVFIRLDGKAKYKSYKSGDGLVVELVNTSVPVKNNTRPLDTSYFNSPVTNVRATPSGGNTRIEIKLKESVPHKVKRIGTTLAVDFTRR